MPKTNVGKIWSLNYRLVTSVITSVAPDITQLGLETKELFVLAEVDARPHPAELAAALCMPKPSVTMYVKRLEAAGFTGFVLVKSESEDGAIVRGELRALGGDQGA